MANNAYIHMDATDYSASKYSYIDLGYVPTLTTNVEIIMKITNDSFNVGDTNFFGMNNSQWLWSPDGGFGARIRTGNSPSYYFEPTYGSHFRDYAFQMPVDTDFTIRFDQTTVAGKFTMYADGVSIQQWDLTSLQNLSLFIFSTNNNASQYEYAHPDEWVKEIKIYEGSTLVRDYVPKTQNGVVGLKDNVQDIFYAPTGEGKMVMVGNNTPEIINPLPAYPKKQTVMFNCRAWEIKSAPIICPTNTNTNAYIQFPDSNDFSSAGYFVTDLYLKNTYTIEAKFKSSSNYGKWRQMFGAYIDNDITRGGWAIQENQNNTNFIYTYWNYGNTRLNDDYAFPKSIDTLYIFITYVGTGDSTLNGVSYSGQGNNANGTLDKPLQIGNVKLQNSDPGFDGRIYYIKVTEGNNLIAYFQADNTDNIPGFVDLVSGVKYINQNYGTITYGEDE